METRHSCQEESFGMKSSSICEILDDSRPDEESAKVDVFTLQTEPGLEQQTPGKQKKTHFKFFSGRKSICTLPSFFGGKHKGLVKGNARKLLSKSKTHDCISDVPSEDGKKTLCENSIRLHRHDLPKAGSTLPSSHSADSGITSPVKLDFNFHDVSPMGSTECFDKKMNADKSFSFPRPKKGLKGLFSSIRRYKKNKTPDPEKFEFNTHNVILETVSTNNSSDDTELQISDDQPKMTNQDCEVAADCSVNVTVVFNNKEAPQCLESLLNIDSPSTGVETNDDLSVDQTPTVDSRPDNPVSLNPEEVLPNNLNTTYAEPEISSHCASDQLSLMFEDVSSLKSFDSMTGCGDIIAEQDIDNISDHSISLDRNREATKRSSCLVTYQGGGEEMATPDDMEEEYLQHLLEEANEGNAGYEPVNENGHELSKDFRELESDAYSMGAEDAIVDRTVLTSTELLTPQSDQQESAPNSDEGYYDSTTPGPDDDAAEGFAHRERLPRDSYSGDALYEFYEPADSLASPAPGGESLYESKTLCSEIFDQFFEFSLPINHNFAQHTEYQVGATETEEQRLTTIQKRLLLWERQREAAMKGIENLNRNIFCKEKSVGCDLRTGRSKECLSNEQISLPNVSKNGEDKVIQHAQLEKQSWKDVKEHIVEDHDFEFNVGTQDHSDAGVARNSKLSHPNISPMHHVSNVCSSDLSCMSGCSQENECEQAVNFSQTLKEFANNGMLFSSISKRLGSAGSSTSFHHNMNALPAMVTFDIVDVENEGECDQQTELSPDEEVASSFETFDHSYVQESLAECDEQLFHMDSQQSFHGLNWGVTSLPRHLDQYKTSLSQPAPLSLNRRSKSLDAETLELELGGLHISKSGLKSYDCLSPWGGGSNSWQYEGTCIPGEEIGFNSSASLRQIVPENEKFETYLPILLSNQGYSSEPQGLVSSNQPSQDGRQIVKSTTELAQDNSTLYKEVSVSCQYSRENSTRKLAWVLPLEEQRGSDTNYSCDYHAPNRPVKKKPIGITQAMPQHKKEDINPLTDFPERSGLVKKGTLGHRDKSQNDWANSYSECSNS